MVANVPITVLKLPQRRCARLHFVSRAKYSRERFVSSLLLGELEHFSIGGDPAFIVVATFPAITSSPQRTGVSLACRDGERKWWTGQLFVSLIVATRIVYGLGLARVVDEDDFKECASIRSNLGDIWVALGGRMGRSRQTDIYSRNGCE